MRGWIERLRRSGWMSGLAVVTVAAPLAVSVTSAVPADAARPAPHAYLGTPVKGAHPVRPAEAKPRTEPAQYTPAHASWPKAATGTATVPVGASRGRTYAAGTPVWVERIGGGLGESADLGVRVLDHTAAVRAGVDGVLFTATPSGARGGGLRIGLDYTSFAQSYGGNYGSRLRLVQLPACALSTPQVAACRVGTPLKSTNDTASRSVSAQVSTATGQAAVVLAATASASGGDGGGDAGSYAATTLKPSGSWSVGGSTGSFGYSYPIKLPPAASTLVPTVALSYDSASLDGQTSATQAQANWLGDGWSTPENYVEQTFVSCADSPEGSAAAQSTGDMCDDGSILTLSLNGSSTSLVCATDCLSGSAVWKPQTDDGEVVTHKVDTGNGTGTYNTDYWTVTDRTGTVYQFGRNELPGWAAGRPTTNSVQYQPVYSAHPGDPCYNATWSSSWCTMAYRWNLDYVTDPHGNAMSYYYRLDTNAYAQNANTGSASSYVRDGHLDHIDYGFTDGGAYGTVPDKVQFTTGDRCVSGTCDPLSSNSANWPDVPYDLNCAAKSTCYVTGPSYWSTVALTGITTQQYNGTGYTTVDAYAMKQLIPAITDGTAPTLFLSSITHTGADTSAGGAAVSVPALSMTPVLLANRTDVNSGLGALDRYRIGAITTETGSVIGISYELTNPCATPVSVTPASNSSSCFPVYWTPAGAGAPVLDWFNKWAVQSVTESDPAGGSGGTYTAYRYPGGAAWHFDDNEVVQARYRTYGQFRGYSDVQTFTGQGADVQAETETTYYRGMSDDNNSTAVTLTDSQGGTHDDTNQLAGDPLEVTDYNFKDGPVTGSTIDSYWVSGATAARPRTGLPALTANTTGQIETWTRQALSDGGTTTWRTTETDTTYDTTTTDAAFGLPTVVYAHGDLSLSGNNQRRCTVTTYAPANTTLNIVGLVAEVETDAVACGGANPQGSSAPTAAQTNALAAPVGVNRPADVVSDHRTFYDLQPLGATAEPGTAPVWPQAAPTRGDVSEVQVANGYANGAFSYQIRAAATLDSFGRTLDTWDALGHETKSSTTMTNGVTVAVTATNALGQAVTTTFDPYRGAPLTTTDANGVAMTVHYDGLGRTIAVWRYGRDTSTAANDLYSYAYGTSTTPTVVTTQVLNDEDGYNTSTALYDSLLRVRQTQAPTPQGGRLVSDTFYDTHGWVTKTNTGYWDTTATPNASLIAIADNAQGNFKQDLLAYDGAGRPVQDQSYDQGALVTTGYHVYYGDRTVTVPPSGTGAGGAASGGTVTATVVDALGRSTELDQYTTRPTVSHSSTGGITTVTLAGANTAANYQATTYAYNNASQQTDVKDVSGADWSTGYNLLGQPVTKTDPDGGTSTIGYDLAGNEKTSTDALGHTLTYHYDALNRKTSLYDGSTQLYSWVYDNSNNAVPGMSHPVGELTTQTAYVGGNAYTVQDAGFNAFGESLGTTVTVPSSEGNLAGSYAYTYTYSTTTGLPTDTTIPAAGPLAAETVGTGYSTSLDLPATLGTALVGLTQNVTYTAYGQVAQAKLGSKSSFALLTNTFDEHTGELTDEQLTNTAVSNTPVDDTSYRYDPFGNPTSQTDNRQGANAETQCFQYDTLDRLVQAWTGTDNCAATPTTASHTTAGDGVASGAYWTTWQYNPDGTRRSETDHALSTGTADAVTSYTYGGTGAGCAAAGGPHTLASTATTGATASATTYCYDKAGNTTQRTTPAQGQQALSWSDTGALTAVTTASAGSSYIYGPDGALLLQKNPGTTTLYLPGQQLALNTATKAVSTTRFYRLPGGGEAVRTGTGSNYGFEVTDQHGTSTLTLNSTLTNPVWRQQTPFGAPRGAAPSAWPDNHGFLNAPQDTATGLTDVGARWYDPATGRFASLDPVLESASPQQLNGYGYAAGNPVSGADPSGLDDWWADPTMNPGVNQGLAQSHGYGGKCTASTCSPDPQCDAACQGKIAAEDAIMAAQSRVQALKAKIAALQAQVRGLQQQLANSSCANAGPFAFTCEGWNWLTDQANKATGEVTKLLLEAAPYIAALATIIGGCGDLMAAPLTCGEAVNVAGAIVVGMPVEGVNPDELLGKAEAELGSGDAGAALDDADQALSASQKQLDAETAELNSAESCLAANSFAGTTPVLLAGGTAEPIDQIKVGDRIANALPGSDPGTRDEAHVVTAIHVTYTDHDYTDVTVATAHGPAVITGTAHHPYWDATTRAWTEADQLRPGDRLESTGGGTVTVVALRDYTATMVTYNLTVDGVHTYYVVAGNTPVLVHNDGGDGPDFATSTQARLAAMRAAGLPTSLQPIKQTYYFAGYGQGGGYQYVYEYNNKRWLVTDNWNDLNADTPHDPHWEVGVAKPGGQLDRLGRERVGSVKAKASYGGGGCG